jgi:hypothetical protein
VGTAEMVDDETKALENEMYGSKYFTAWITTVVFALWAYIIFGAFGACLVDLYML